MWHVWAVGINEYRALLEVLKKRDHLEELGVDGRIILEWIAEE